MIHTGSEGTEYDKHTSSDVYGMHYAGQVGGLSVGNVGTALRQAAIADSAKYLVSQNMPSAMSASMAKRRHILQQQLMWVIRT